MFPETRRLHLVTSSRGMFSGGLKVVTGLSFAFFSAIAAAGVYKCENTSGQIAYQATPCAGTSSQSEVKIRNTQPTSKAADVSMSSPSLPDTENPNEQRDSGFQVYDQFGKLQLKIANGTGGWVSRSLPATEKKITQLKKQLEQAKNCDAQQKQRIEQWEMKKEANLKAALADCERRRNSYCDSRDPQKIVNLYNMRNNPHLDLAMNKDPVETGRRVTEMNQNKRLQEMRIQMDSCASEGARYRWQQELERHQKAVAAAK